MKLRIIDLVLAVAVIRAVALICAIAIILVSGREAPQQAASQESGADLEQSRSPEDPETVTVQEPVVPEPGTAVRADVQSNTEAKAQTESAQPERDPRYNDPVYKEQLGRNALAYIGRNPEAEAVWIQVINDPTLSANARRNLIEDLNEDGLSNPRNPTADDLPVILYRIQLIEQLAPSAMDQVNSEAFQEAYRDLVNLAARLM